MNDTKLRERVRLLLSQPSYRTKLFVFVLVGSVIALLALFVKDPFWQGVLSNFCVTFFAVALIQIMWDFLGGDPLDARLVSMQAQVEERMTSFQVEMRSLKDSMILMRDLLDGNLGIQRMWPNRRAWQKDADCGPECWKDWVCQAKVVRIVSNTLWNNWFQDASFRTSFLAHLKQDQEARAQIIIYDPNGPALQMRARDEDNLVGLGDGYDVASRMREEIRHALQKLASMKTAEELMGESGRLEIRLSRNSMLLAHIVQADDRMLVAIYLSGSTGGPSPTLQLRGPDTSYFRTYSSQFEILWERAAKLEYDELTTYLNPPKIPSSNP